MPRAYRRGMDHDGIHKLAYRLRAMFADLLRLVVPALAEALDLDRAEEVSAAHVGVGADGLRQRQGDLVWRVPFKRTRRRTRREGMPALPFAEEDHSPPYLVVLLEFQSTVDRGMAERMRNYSAMLRERLAFAGEAGGPTGWPWLLPLVVYNGADAWTAPGAAMELAPLPSAQAERLLAPYQAWDYFLFSLQRLLAEGGVGLARLPLANPAAATLRLQAERTPAALGDRLRQEWMRFAGAKDAATRRVFHAWASALVADTDGAEAVIPSLAELEGTLEGGKNMTTVSQARLGKWFEDFRAEHAARGFEEGLQRGIEEGIERGIKRGVERGIERGVERGRVRILAMLRQQAATKFDDRTAEQLAVLLDDASANGQLERVGEWIMTCNTSSALLDRVFALTGDPTRRR